MNLPSILLEGKILEAIAKGQLDNLPGAGKPLDLDKHANVPVEMRMAYRVMDSAGMIPADISVMQEIEQLKQKLVTAFQLSLAEREQIQKKLVLKQAEVNIKMEQMLKGSGR